MCVPPPPKMTSLPPRPPPRPPRVSPKASPHPPLPKFPPLPSPFRHLPFSPAPPPSGPAHKPTNPAPLHPKPRPAHATHPRCPGYGATRAGGSPPTPRPDGKTSPGRLPKKPPPFPPPDPKRRPMPPERPPGRLRIPAAFTHRLRHLLAGRFRVAVSHFRSSPHPLPPAATPTSAPLSKPRFPVAHAHRAGWGGGGEGGATKRKGRGLPGSLSHVTAALPGATALHRRRRRRRRRRAKTPPPPSPPLLPSSPTAAIMEPGETGAGSDVTRTGAWVTSWGRRGSAGGFWA